MANRDDDRNLSRQLAELLKSQIEQGIPAVGQKLPPYRELVERHGMARNTVQAAMRLLEIEGVVEIRGTAGVFVRDLAAGATPEEELRAELTSVRRQLKDARQVLTDTEAAVTSLLKKLPAELSAE